MGLFHFVFINLADFDILFLVSGLFFIFSALAFICLFPTYFFLGLLLLLILLWFFFSYHFVGLCLFFMHKILNDLSKNLDRLKNYCLVLMVLFMSSIGSRILFILISIFFYNLIGLSYNPFEGFLIYKDFRKFWLAFPTEIFIIFLVHKIIRKFLFNFFLFNLVQFNLWICLDQKFRIEQV